VGEDQLGDGARTEGNQDGGSQELGESLAELFSVKVVGGRGRGRGEECAIKLG
jgi:hypothetical protein